jgi:hypothetical protein
MDEEVQEVDDDRLGLLPQSSHRKRPPSEGGGNFPALKLYCQNETHVFIFSFLCLVVVLFVISLSKVESNDAVVAAIQKKVESLQISVTRMQDILDVLCRGKEFETTSCHITNDSIPETEKSHISDAILKLQENVTLIQNTLIPKFSDHTSNDTSSSCPKGKIYVFVDNSLNDIICGRPRPLNVLLNGALSTSQHSMPLYAQIYLPYNPCITNNLEEATLYIVPVPFDWNNGCKNRLASIMKSSQPWKYRHKDFFVILWDKPKSVWDPATQGFDDADAPHSIKWVNSTGGVCVSSAQHNCKEIWSTWTKNHLTLPYYQNYSIVDPFQSRDVIASGAWSSRRKEGRDKFVALELRANCAEALKRVNGTFIDLYFPTGDPIFHFTSLNAYDNAYHIEEVYSRSNFTVVPKGDSPSRRALEDAILKGSIPIICSDHFIPPFEQLDWSSFSFHIPEVFCADFVENLKYMREVELLKMKKALKSIQLHFQFSTVSAEAANSKGGGLDTLLEHFFFKRNHL